MSTLIDNLNYIESCKLDIKSAIEDKGVDMTGVSFPDYAAAIGNITTQFVTESLSVSQNGTYTPGQGVDGFSQVSVNVPSYVPVTTTLSVSQNGTYTPGQGVDGFSQVSVNVPQSVTGYTINDVASGNYNLTTLYCSASWIRAYAFYSMRSITSIDLPNCEKLGGFIPGVTIGAHFTGDCFEWCSNLISVSLPACLIIGGNTFANCTALQSINLPLCKQLDSNVFSGCIKLSLVDFGVCNSIGNHVFSINDNTVHLSVYFRSNTVCVSGGVSVFRGKTNLSIYVPASLVDSYKTAWSKVSNKIFPIPE